MLKLLFVLAVLSGAEFDPEAECRARGGELRVLGELTVALGEGIVVTPLLGCYRSSEWNIWAEVPAL